AVQTLHEASPVARAAEDALVALASRYPKEARGQADIMMEQDAFFLPAAILLGATGRVEATAERDMVFLAHATTAGDPQARRAAVEAVAEIDGPTAVEVLSFALADEEHEVQVAAARGLGRLATSSQRTPSDVRALLDVVEGTEAPELVAASVRAIGEGLYKLAPGAPAF